MKPLTRYWRDDLIHSDIRAATNKLLEMIDEGLINPRDVVTMCLKWMSEDDVKEMCKANEIDFEIAEDVE